jgi:WD40 repeat protein
MFARAFKLDYNQITFPPGKSSWKREFQRLYWTTPSSSQSENESCEVLSGHLDEVNHVAFSADGDFFATCGKDVQIIVWKATGEI